jgi:HK97 gp10 family phage protein
MIRANTQKAQKALRRYRRIVRKQMIKAVRRSAESVLAGAESRAPVRTGELKKDLRIAYSGKTEGTRAGIGNDIYYSLFVELGTEQRKERPYLRPALEAEVSAFYANVADGLDTAAVLAKEL